MQPQLALTISAVYLGVTHLEWQASTRSALCSSYSPHSLHPCSHSPPQVVRMSQINLHYSDLVNNPATFTLRLSGNPGYVMSYLSPAHLSTMYGAESSIYFPSIYLRCDVWPAILNTSLGFPTPSDAISFFSSDLKCCRCGEVWHMMW